MNRPLAFLLAVAVLSSAAVAVPDDAAQKTAKAQAKLKAKQNARAADDAKPATRAEVQSLREQVEALAKSVDALRKQLAVLSAELKERPVAPQAGPGDDKIAAAMAENRFAIGMTRDQADLSWKRARRVTHEFDGGEVVEWGYEIPLQSNKKRFVRQWTTTFRNGKIASISDHTDEDSGMRAVEVSPRHFGGGR